MTRVPVGRSIAHAYEFLFGRFFQIIGIAWLPTLVYGVGYYIVLANAQAWVNLGDPVSSARTAGLAVLVLLAATLIHAVIAVSLTQEALGVRKDLTLAHLVIGPRELRLFFGLLLYFLLFAVLYTIVVAACVGLLFVARNYGAGLAPNLAFHGRSAAVVGAAAIALVVLAWFWLSMLRLLFLLAPIASVEHRLRLSRAWQLTGGSTLRTFIVLVVVFLPVMIVAWAANRFVLHIGTIGLQPHATPMEVVTHVLAFYGANAGSLALISAALAVLNGALLAGASAAAYRTVTHHEEAEPEDDAALVAPLLLAEEPHPVDDRHLEPDHAVAPVAQHGHDHDNRDHADVDPDDEHGRTDDNHGHGDADSMPQGAHSHADGNVAHDGHGHEAHADQAHAHEDHSAHGEGHHHHDGEHPGHATAHDGTEHASGGDGVDPIHSKSELVARAA